MTWWVWGPLVTLIMLVVIFVSAYFELDYCECDYSESIDGRCEHCRKKKE